MDVAALGLAVDSSGVVAATLALDRMSVAARNGESVARALEARAKDSGKSFEELAGAYERAKVEGVKFTGATKDNAAAMGGATNSSKMMTGALGAVQSAAKQLSHEAESLSGELGRLGGFLTGLGPAGLIVAATWGGAALSFKLASDAAREMAARAGDLKNFAETTGFTTDQLQALERAGANVGVRSNQISSSLEQFSVSMEGVRKHSGPLYESLLAINPVLAKQVADSKSLSTAYDLVAKALSKVDLEERNKLSKTAFGRSGIPMTRLTASTIDVGGMQALVAAQVKSDQLTEKQIEEWDRLGSAISQNMKDAKQNIASIFTSEVLNSLNNFSQGFLSISRTAKEFTISPDFKAFLDWLKTPVGNGVGGAGAGAAMGGMVGGPVGALIGGSFFGLLGVARGVQRYNEGRASLDNLPHLTVQNTKEVDENTKAILERRAALEKTIPDDERMIGILGSAATAQQLHKLAVDKLTLAMLKNHISADGAAAGIGRLNQSYNAQQFSQYVGLLGQSASVSDQVRIKTDQIAIAAQNGVRLTREQIAAQIELARENALGITAMKAQADAYKTQAGTIGMSLGQAVAYTAEQNRLNEALRNHQTLTEADKAAIHASAVAMGEAAQASAEKLAKDQALFDLQTAGLTGVDQQVAQLQFRLHGKDWQQFMNDGLAATMRLTDAMRQMNDAVKGFGQDLLSNLQRGDDAFKSLLGAASNFATKLANMGLDKMMSGLTGGGDFSKIFGGDLGSAIGKGVKQSLDDIELKSRNAATNPANGFMFNGTGAVGKGLMAGAAGLGIYAQGQQIGASGGSATTGALSGALTGAMAGATIGGPVGAVIGAVVGGIAGLLGASDGAKKAAQQAKDDWANAKVAADLFGKQLAGSGQGSLTTALAQAKSQTEQYTIMAQKAKDQDSSDRLGQQYNQYYKRMTEAFRDSFGGIVDAFNSGLGPSSPFATGAKNVKDIGDELKGFIEDTKTAMEYLAPGASGSAVAQATAAAQKYMLSLLGQAPVLTDTQTAIQHLNGTAAQLQTTLVDLGMSSKDAADAINAGVLASMKQLADTFANGIQREINAASGQDWKNSLSDLVAKFQSNLADAAALGLGPDLVNQWFKVSAQKIVDDAGLAGDAVAALVRQFPDLAGVITASVQSLQSLYDAATSQVDSARADLQKAYEAESSALQSTIDKTRAWIAQLKQFQQSLNIGQSSPYSPEQQYNLAKQQAQQDLALAMSGDQDAMERIQGDLSTYLDQSRSYNASSEQYFRDFKEAQDMLDKLQASGQRQIDTGQQQLDALNRQVSGLIDIKDMIGVTNTSVLSVAAAIAALQSALAGQKQAAGNLVNASPQSNIDALYQSVLGRSADAAGKAYWQQQVAAGLSGTDLTRSFISGAYAKGGSDAAAAAAYAKLHGYQNGGIVGMYANGGIVGNGLLGVDSVMARYASGGYIGLAGGEGVINANATRSLGGAPAIAALNTGRVPSNDNSAVVSEIKTLRAAVERLAAVIGLSDAETRKLLKEGNDVAKDSASAMKLVASK